MAERTGNDCHVRSFIKRVHPVKAIQFDYMEPTPAYEFLRRRNYETRCMSGVSGGFYFQHRYAFGAGEFSVMPGDWLVDEGGRVAVYADKTFRTQFLAANG